MILKALYDYYQRKSKLGDIAPLGMEIKQIPFLIVIDEDGKFLSLQDTRADKKDKGKKFLLPKAEGRSGKNAWQSPNLLWDHFGFILGRPKDNSPKALADAKNQSGAFANKICELAKAYPQNTDFSAVAKFISNPDRLAEVEKSPLWGECEKIAGCNATFKIAGKGDIVCANPDVVDFIEKSLSANDDAEKSVCLITGNRAELAMIHTGVSLGGQSGVKLVSFQKASGFDSYYKEQGQNAPISKDAELAYTSALNTLLARDSHNRAFIGALNIVFWGDEKSDLETSFASIFNAPSKDDPDASVAEIKNLLESVQKGRAPVSSQNRFYVLGLEPNKTRMVVRFWYAASVAEISANIAQHFSDLEIVKSKMDREYFSIFNILTQLALENKTDNLPPKLESDLLKSIISNSSYPHTLQMQCLNRIRADRKINRIRAAVLKAYLNRKNRLSKNEKEIKMSLDIENNNIGYLCGRLFAVLEKIQQRALGANINATIVDRYYGSASTTPVTVFGKLMDLSNHHLSKIDNQGAVVVFKKLLGEIFDKMPASGFPAHLTLDDQSRFAVGYYQQTQKFFEKKEDNK